MVAMTLRPWKCGFVGFAAMSTVQFLGHRIGMGKAVGRVRAVTEGQCRLWQRQTGCGERAKRDRDTEVESCAERSQHEVFVICFPKPSLEPREAARKGRRRSQNGLPPTLGPLF